LRPLYYPETDLFLVLLSVVDINSVHHITEKWIPEISHHVKNPNFIFVGNKIDLLENEEEMKKRREEGFNDEEMKSSIKNLRGKYPDIPYIETSCMTKINMEEVMISGFREIFKEKSIPKKDGCFIN
jgi:small GTP-binding protein